MEHISIKELPVEVTPSFIMDFNDYQVKEVDGVLKVAYLADDEDPLHIPVENEHLFRFKMNADSGLRVHRFRTPQCTYSDVR